jgi:hypothetical protein
VTISEARRMNEAIFAALADPEPLFWRPRRRAIKVGETWHVWLAIPRLTPDGEDSLRDLVVRGTGRTIRAAESDMRRRLNRHGRLYRLALTIDLRARAVGALNEFTRMKMKEGGILRRMMPMVPIDHVGRVLKEVFAGWGPDGKATFKVVAVDRDGKYHEPVTGEWGAAPGPASAAQVRRAADIGKDHTRV